MIHRELEAHDDAPALPILIASREDLLADAEVRLAPRRRFLRVGKREADLANFPPR
jgi:hypothetical protein